MNRRTLIKQIGLITGATVLGSEFFLSGCTHADSTTGLYTPKDLAFFDEVAETIIPRTSTPGAKDAAVGAFMAHYASDCYDAASQYLLKKGIELINESATSRYKKGFLALTPTEKEILLTETDAAAHKYESNKKNENDPPHYFTLLKQLTLLGFFTSKPGITQVLRYNPVPGKYEGCIPYNNETSWA